jgi:hypothetical protein
MSCFSKTVAICLGIAGYVMAQMQPVVSGPEGEGNIDWSSRMIVATGIGAPNPNLPQAAQRPGAERAAQQIALRNALETVKGIFLNSSTTVENFMTTSDVVSSRVSGFVKGFQQKGRTKYMSDGTVEITMEIPLDGFGYEMLQDQIGEKPSITKFEGEKAKKEMVFTGLIIDCRGLSIKPALSPKVIDESGREVYGSAYVTKEWAIKYGVVGYSKDVAEAAKLERVGTTPGQIKALKADGQNSTDIVIADKDAGDIRSAGKNLKFLSECRVIFVVD